MNEQNIQKLIYKKEKSTPFYGSIQQNNSTSNEVITDYDNFPYTRWYRGRPDFIQPIVAEREAGFRTIENRCYTDPICKKKEESSYTCFQKPCSTVIPIYCKETLTSLTQL